MMRFILDCLRTPRHRAPSCSERDKNSLEQDERVVQKTSQIRELEDAVQVEGIELQEQNSDRRELEETLERLDKHRAELVEQIKLTRLQCCQESQQILSLQAEEVKRETTVEEYERELARVRRKLKQLREEVREAQRKVEEAGERTVPLQESISQSYQEILEEEQKLHALRGERDAVLTSDLRDEEQEEDVSPASCTTDDIPLRPWGRSQSLPAYADVILRRCGSSSITNNPLSEKEEEDSLDTPISSSSKIITSHCEEEKAEEGVKEECAAPLASTSSIAIDELDFYHPDPFIHCETEHDLFKDDLFSKRDQSDVFADDPFKGTDPFAADILFPEGSEVKPIPDSSPLGLNDEVDTSLSCAENKASTGTQCFESEFPDEDESSDIEISYSREDLDTIAMGEYDPTTTTTSHPDTQSFDISQLAPSRETRTNTWATQPNYSIESDPNGYEFDINAVSPPSDIEEVSLGSIPASYDSLGAGIQSPPGPDFQARPHPEFQSSPPGPDVQSPPGPDFQSPPGPDFQSSPHPEFQALPDPDFQFPPHPEFQSSPHPEFQPSPPGLDFQSPPHPEFQSPPHPEFQPSPPHPEFHALPDPDTDSSDVCEFQTRVEEAGSSPDQAGCPDTTNPEPTYREPHSSTDLVDVTSSNCTHPSDSELDSAIGTDAQSSTEHNSKFSFGNDSFEFSYEPASHSSFDPYGFKLSPEHNSIQDILDPFGSDLTSDPGNQASFDPYEFEPSSSQPDDEGVTFDPYGFDLAAQPSHPGTYDPYGFKLTPEMDNQALLHLGNSSDDPHAPEANNNNTVNEMDPFGFQQPADPATTNDLLGLELSNTVAPEGCLDTATTSNPSSIPANTLTTSVTTNMAASAGCDLLGGDLDAIFGTGGYVACPDVADDLEPFEPRVGNPVDPPPDNRAFRGRDAAHSESSDTAADWMTVRSNSRDSFGPVNPHTRSLDK